MKQLAEDIQTITVGELVANDYRRAEVFRKYKMDFCCGGKQLLVDVCRRKAVDVEAVWNELHELDGKEGDAEDNFTEWNVDLLSTYIEQTHHRYITKSIPVLLEYSRKVARVHGEKHPETLLLADLVTQVTEDLLVHMKNEEHVLFPYIHELAEADRFNEKPVTPPFRSAINPVRMMEMEHDLAGDLMHRMAEITSDYTPPADACSTFRVLYAKLAEFERDLNKHIHLENNVLFPAAVRLETTLRCRPEF